MYSNCKQDCNMTPWLCAWLMALLVVVFSKTAMKFSATLIFDICPELISNPSRVEATLFLSSIQDLYKIEKCPPGEGGWWRGTAGARPPSASTPPAGGRCAHCTSGSACPPQPSPRLPYLHHTTALSCKGSSFGHVNIFPGFSFN